MEISARWERLVEFAAWMATAGIGTVMLTQAIGWDGFRLLATVHSLTPYLIPLAAVPAGIAAWRAWRPLAATSSMVGIAGLLLATPLVFPPGQPTAQAGAKGIRVVSINLLYTNPDVGDIGDVLVTRDADVIVFSEYTADHQETLVGHPVAEQYPYREDRVGLNAGGMAVWSKFPIRATEPPDTINYSIDAVLDGPDGDVRILAVHPPTPIYDFPGWRRDLALVGETAHRPGPPTLLVGDFNASYWHPVFRDLLRTGLTDVHMANGHGWSTSWPTDRFVPPFVRLDHALTDDRLASKDVDDFRVPGSDHAGLAVTILPAR